MTHCFPTLYGRAVAILGASGGVAFGALVPALSALLAIPRLDEWPNETDGVGIVLMSAGAYLASGGPIDELAPKPRSRPKSILRQRCSVLRSAMFALHSNPIWRSPVIDNGG